MAPKRRRLRKRRKLFKRRVKLKAVPRAEEPVDGEGVSPMVEKYWLQRFNLFSKYDDGIKMDEEGWFSVTPEEIAARQADRCFGGAVVIDGFTGVGGNAIQFAAKCNHVIAIDIDPKKIEMARNNARIYGVEEYIDFLTGDFFQLAPFLKGDIVFLSPPWGGPTYKLRSTYTLDLLKPKDGYSLFQAAQNITPNIMMYLPRNVDLLQVEQLSWLSLPPLQIQCPMLALYKLMAAPTQQFIFIGGPRFLASYACTA
nr:Trimethylguanosine synthase [Ipomoea batatas]